MSKSKVANIKSSAGEYLTFVASTGEQGIEIRYEDENIWLTQKLMAELYGVDVRTISEHLQGVFRDQELNELSVIRNFRITATDGKSYSVQHYNLQAKSQFEKYRITQDRLFESDFDRMLAEVLREGEVKINKSNNIKAKDGN